MNGDESLTKPTKQKSSCKKLFSIPIGKLRNKTLSKSGSSSRSVSSSSGGKVKRQYRLVVKNNRELACALSKEKERKNFYMQENLQLASSHHERKLEIIRLKKEYQKDLEKMEDCHREFRNCVLGSLKDAVKYSVLLTDCLKTAMESVSTLSESDISQRDVNVNVRQKADNPSICSPQKQRVNPMISGLTIKHPTIKLKRVCVEEVDKTTDRNDVQIEDVAENLESAYDSENSSEQLDSRLSTCIEETEEEWEDEVNPLQSRDEVQEESFRRRTVSFRNRTVDRDRKILDLEDEDSSQLQGEDDHVLKKSPLRRSKNSFENSRILSKQDSALLSQVVNNLSPVVALTDVSKLVENSSTVDLSKVSSEGHKILKEGSLINPIELIKENIPSNDLSLRSSGHKRHVSITLEHILQTVDVVNDVDVHGRSENRPIKLASRDEDPLEGTSWMYKDLCERKSKKRRNDDDEDWSKKPSRRPPRRKNKAPNRVSSRSSKKKAELISSSSEITESQDNTVSRTADSDRTKENENAHKPQAQETENDKEVSAIPIQDLSAAREPCSGTGRESMLNTPKDLSDIKNAVIKNLVVQSTPKSVGQNVPVKENGDLSLDQLPSSVNYSDSTIRNTLMDKNSPNEHSLDAEEASSEKDAISLSFEAEILSNKFVTVRVKRCDRQIESTLKSSFIGDVQEDNGLKTSVCSRVISPQTFLGFGVEEVCSEESEALKMNLGIISKKLLSTENQRNIPALSYASNRSCDSKEYSIDAYSACSDDTDVVTRPRRKAAPTVLKEPSLKIKKRRENPVKNGKKK